MKKIILILTIIFLSCERKSEFEENLIKNNKNTFWVKKVKDSSGTYIDLQQHFVFNENKSKESFSSDNENIKGFRSPLLIEGHKPGLDWHYFEENNTFVMFPDLYLINKYTQDTIYMTLLNNQTKRFILVKKEIR